MKFVSRQRALSRLYNGVLTVEPLRRVAMSAFLTLEEIPVEMWPRVRQAHCGEGINSVRDLAKPLK